MIRRVLFLLFAVALLLGACGDDGADTAADTADDADASDDAATGEDDSSAASDDTDEAGSGDVCALVDLDAVSTFAGGADVAITTDDERECQVDAATGDPIEPSFSVTLFENSSMSDYETVRDINDDAVVIDDLADAAHYTPSVQTVTFIKGDTMVNVQLVGGEATDADIEAFVVAQARVAADRL